VLAQALYLGPYHQLTIFDDSVGQLLSDIQWDGLRILNAQFPLRVKRSIDRTRSTVLTHTFNQLLRQAIPHLVRAPSREQSQNLPVFHYTSDIVMNLVPESDWYVDFPNGIRLVNTGKFRPFSDSLQVREWHGDRLVLMVHVFQEKRREWRMEWGTECKFLVLLQHAKVIIRMWLVGRREAETCSVSWSKGVRVMAERAGFGENIPFKIAIEALLKEAWYDSVFTAYHFDVAIRLAVTQPVSCDAAVSAGFYGSCSPCPRPPLQNPIGVQLR